MNYMVYGKQKNEKRFHACNLKNGSFVDRLVYASLIIEVYVEKMQDNIIRMYEQNADFVFDIRRVQ